MLDVSEISYTISVALVQIYRRMSLSIVVIQTEKPEK